MISNNFQAQYHCTAGVDIIVKKDICFKKFPSLQMRITLDCMALQALEATTQQHGGYYCLEGYL